MRGIIIALLVILVGGGVWFVATRWSDAPTEDPAVRERIAEAPSSTATPPTATPATPTPATPAPSSAAPATTPTAGERPSGAEQGMVAPGEREQATGVPPATQGEGEATSQESGGSLGSANPPGDPQVVSNELQTAMNEALATATDVADETSADSAVRVLRDVETRLQGITVDASALPENGRGQIVSVAEKALPDLRTRADALRSQGGPAERVAVELDKLIGRLEAFTTGPG